jgi:hypothetical protein
MMVYDTRNDWDFGLCPTSGSLKKETTTFRKLNLFLSSDEETPTLLSPLVKANVNHLSNSEFSFLRSVF